MRLPRRTVSNGYGIFVLRNALFQCWVWSVAKIVELSVLESHCAQRPTIVTIDQLRGKPSRGSRSRPERLNT